MTLPISQKKKVGGGGDAGRKGHEQPGKRKGGQGVVPGGGAPSMKWDWYCHLVPQAPKLEWGQWISYVYPTCMSVQCLKT